jgi:stress response protein YsnF
MPDEENEEYVVPVVQEEVHADAVPVQTGGVRVTKHVEGHDEILEQELRRGRVEVKRVKTDRVVDGPQQVERVGNTLVIPVVSEVLRVEKQWVVTEEIHITQIEETETVQQPGNSLP